MTEQLESTPLLTISYPGDDLAFWQSLMQQHFNIWRDHRALIEGIDLDRPAFGQHFDSLRRVYADRREYESFELQVDCPPDLANIASQLGFRLKGKYSANDP